MRTVDLESIVVLLATLPMIGWRKQSVPFRLLMYAIANDRGNELGTVLSEREAHAWTGLSRNTVYNGLALLVDHRVLLRFDGGGPRGHAFRVNPELRDWLVPWLNAREPKPDEMPSRTWLAKQEIVLSRVDRFAHRNEMRKNRTAARPAGAVTRTAARTSAPLWAPSGAPERATAGPLVARTSARLDDLDPRDAPSSRELLRNSRSMERSKEAQQVLAVINEQGATVTGGPAREIEDLVAGTDVLALIAKIRATPGLKWFGYLDLVRQHTAIVTLPPAEGRAPTPAWEPPDTSDATPPPWILAGISRAEWTVSAACETVGGGAP